MSTNTDDNNNNNSGGNTCPWPTIVNPDSTLSVQEFDNCVAALQNPNTTGVADAVLRAFASEPRSFMRIDGVLRHSSRPDAQHIALNVLSDTIHRSWHTLDPGMRTALRDFIVDFVMQVGTNRVALSQYRFLVVKAAETLVAIAKHEWPDRWPTFVDEVLESAAQSVEAAQNAMLILQLLLEEIYSSNSGSGSSNRGRSQMTTAWMVRRKAAIAPRLERIFVLCFQVVMSSSNAVTVDVIARAFDTLATLIPCLDAQVVLDDRIVQLSQTLAGSICEPHLRIPAVRCLQELAALAGSVEMPDGPIARGALIPVSRGGGGGPPPGSSNRSGLAQQNNCQPPGAGLIAETFIAVMNNCAYILDEFCGPPDMSTMDESLMNAMNISNGDNDNNGNCKNRNALASEPLETRIMHAMTRSDKFETFFQCIAMYATHIVCNFLPTLLLGAGAAANNGNNSSETSSASASSQQQQHQQPPGGNNNSGLFQNAIPCLQWVSRLFIALAYSGNRESLKIAVDFWWQLGDMLVRRHNTHARDFINDDLEDIRLALIRNMARPEEVTVFEDEFGELQHQELSDVESVQLYVTMREALVFIAHIDPKGIESNMMELLERQLNRTEWNWAALNSLCWSYGAISGAFRYDEEKTFFVNFVRNLLKLCEGMRGQANRAVIASGVMYVLGQYPQFLMSHARFLRTVLNKLHDFFREPFPGIKEMSVDTLLKINARCASVLWNSTDHNSNPPVPQAVSVVLGAEETAMELNHHERYTFYEAMGHIAAAAPSRDDAQRVVWQLLQRCNDVIRAVTAAAGTDVAAMLAGYDDLRSVLHSCRVIARVAKTCGPCFLQEMSEVVFPAMTTLLPLFAQRIAQVVESQGPAALQHQNTRVLKQLKREFLRITEHFVAATDRDGQFLAEQVFPHVFGFILRDYAQGHPATRDAEVLALVTAAVKKSGEQLVQSSGGTVVHVILESLFTPTVELITGRATEEMPEHRINFFRLLDALCTVCFGPFLDEIRENSELLEGVFWAVRHQEPHTSAVACEMLIQLLNRIGGHPARDAFCEHYLPKIFSVVLEVLVDQLHQQGFRLQCALLQRLFALTLLLRRSGEGQQATASAILETVASQDLAKLETLSPPQVSRFMNSALTLCEPVDTTSVEAPEQFVELVADFLVEVKVWGAANDTEFSRQQGLRMLEGELAGLARPMPTTRSSIGGSAAGINSRSDEID